MPKKTAMFEEHQKLGGRLIDFGGWELPVQYTGLLDEHTTCRTKAGLFDVSHMGEIHVEGKDSMEYLDYLVTNHVAALGNGQICYTEMCNERGGIVDDLLVYKRNPEKFLCVVNASNTDKDFKHFQSIEKLFRSRKPNADLRVTNESPNYSQIAIQGRFAEKILQPFTKTDLSQIKYYWFAEGTVLNGTKAVLSRTGYTGEDGFEIYLPWNEGPALWRALIEEGKEYGLKPCGLGARDTLRLEVKFPLYGHELGDDTNPFAAGVGWTVKLKKGDFHGRDQVVKQKEAGFKRIVAGLKLNDRGVPRQGYAVYSADGSKKIGDVTSGTQSPSLNIPIALAYLDLDQTAIGNKVMIEIRDRKYAAEVIPTPFYKRDY